MTSPPLREAEWWRARDEPLMRHGAAWIACGMGAEDLGMAMGHSARQSHMGHSQCLHLPPPLGRAIQIKSPSPTGGLWEHNCPLCPLCRGFRTEQP